jgi:hypothetical protein
MIDFYKLEIADIRLMGIKEGNMRRYMNFTQLSKAMLPR